MDVKNTKLLPEILPIEDSVGYAPSEDAYTKALKAQMALEGTIAETKQSQQKQTDALGSFLGYLDKAYNSGEQDFLSTEGEHPLIGLAEQGAFYDLMQAAVDNPFLNPIVTYEANRLAAKQKAKMQTLGYITQPEKAERTAKSFDERQAKKDEAALKREQMKKDEAIYKDAVDKLTIARQNSLISNEDAMKMSQFLESEKDKGKFASFTEAVDEISKIRQVIPVWGSMEDAPKNLSPEEQLALQEKYRDEKTERDAQGLKDRWVVGEKEIISGYRTVMRDKPAHVKTYPVYSKELNQEVYYTVYQYNDGTTFARVVDKDGTPLSADIHPRHLKTGRGGGGGSGLDKRTTTFIEAGRGVLTGALLPGESPTETVVKKVVKTEKAPSQGSGMGMGHGAAKNTP